MSIQSLLSRFGAFIRGLYTLPPQAGPEVPFPFRLRSQEITIGHHLVPLIMLARSDGELSEGERDVIVAHCQVLSTRRGQRLNPQELTDLETYIGHLAPDLAVLDPALRRLESGGHDELADLFSAAHRVILVDDIVKAGELNQLVDIMEQLDRLRAKP